MNNRKNCSFKWNEKNLNNQGKFFQINEEKKSQKKNLKKIEREKIFLSIIDMNKNNFILLLHYYSTILISKKETLLYSYEFK